MLMLFLSLLSTALLYLKYTLSLCLSLSLQYLLHFLSGEKLDPSKIFQVSAMQNFNMCQSPYPVSMQTPNQNAGSEPVPMVTDSQVTRMC